MELPCFVADNVDSDEENVISAATSIRPCTFPSEALHGFDKASYRSASITSDDKVVKMGSAQWFGSHDLDDALKINQVEQPIPVFSVTTKRRSSEFECKESGSQPGKIAVPSQHLQFPARDSEFDVKPICTSSCNLRGRHDLHLVNLNTQHTAAAFPPPTSVGASPGHLTASLSHITGLGSSHTRVGVLKFDDTSTDGDTTGLAGESFRQHTAGMNTQLKSSQNNKLKSSHRKRFLVVDDVALNRKMLSRFLVSRDCDVEEASDGVEAVEKVRLHMGTQEEYDVITMDYQMPVMDGPTATRLIRDMGYQGLIVGVTGNALADDVGTFVSNGVNTVFVKPLDVQAFFDYLSIHF